ncbi:hypothetical protein NCCP133_36170 [Cytobacillus sp. NCCP-133]|nr:hypothetical protein NCCP133_36170 [Cytobacillus sp. NCCP-133]
MSKDIPLSFVGCFCLGVFVKIVSYRVDWSGGDLTLAGGEGAGDPTGEAEKLSLFSSPESKCPVL